MKSLQRSDIDFSLFDSSGYQENYNHCFTIKLSKYFNSKNGRFIEISFRLN